jgi:hypothetical protein
VINSKKILWIAVVLEPSLLFLINGLNPNMAYLKTRSYHNGDIADHWVAIGVLAIKGQIRGQDHP